MMITNCFLGGSGGGSMSGGANGGGAGGTGATLSVNSGLTNVGGGKSSTLNVMRFTKLTPIVSCENLADMDQQQQQQQQQLQQLLQQQQTLQQNHEEEEPKKDESFEVLN